MPTVRKAGKKTKHFTYGPEGSKKAIAYAKKVGGKVTVTSGKNKPTILNEKKKKKKNGGY